MAKPPHQPSARPSATDQALQAALLALQTRRPAEAERIAADILKANRGNAGAAGLLGRALMMQNRAAEAIAPLRRVARLADDPALETQLAAALAAAGQRDEALQQLRRAMARRPAFLPAFMAYAGELRDEGSYADAIAALDGGQVLFPDSLELRVELAFLHVKRNDRSTARAILSKALEAAPRHPHVLTSLAQVLHLDGAYAEAAETYRRVLAARPDNAAVRKNLGACLLEMGEREAGEASIRAAVRAAPQLSGQAIVSLAAASHGRFFLRPSAAEKFLRKR